MLNLGRLYRITNKTPIDDALLYTMVDAAIKRLPVLKKQQLLQFRITFSSAKYKGFASGCMTTKTEYNPETKKAKRKVRSVVVCAFNPYLTRNRKNYRRAARHVYQTILHELKHVEDLITGQHFAHFITHGIGRVPLTHSARPQEQRAEQFVEHFRCSTTCWENELIDKLTTEYERLLPLE